MISCALKVNTLCGSSIWFSALLREKKREGNYLGMLMIAFERVGKDLSFIIFIIQFLSSKLFLSWHFYCVLLLSILSRISNKVILEFLLRLTIILTLLWVRFHMKWCQPCLRSLRYTTVLLCKNVIYLWSNINHLIQKLCTWLLEHSNRFL